MIARNPTNENALDGLVVVVPAYNPGPLLVRVLEGLRDVGARAIVIDDGSTDDSCAVADDFPVARVRLERNRGKGHALLAGFKRALDDPGTGAVAVLDADGQHDPAELAHLYGAFSRERADLLIGSRNFTGADVPFRSRFGNQLTVVLVKVLLGAVIPDTQSGYRILSRRFVERVAGEIPGGRYETEMAIVGLAIRGGYRIASEPIQTIYIDGNARSNFRKVRDSYRVYRTLFRSALRKSTPVAAAEDCATSE